MGGGEMMVSDDEIVMRIMGVVQNADLTTTTTAAIRRQLEEDLGTDLTEKKAFIRQQVDLYLQAQQQQQQQQHQQHQHHLYLQSQQHYLHSLQQQQQQQPFLQPHYYAANYAPPQVVEDDADVDEDNVVQRDPEPEPRRLSHAKTKRAKKDGPRPRGRPTKRVADAISLQSYDAADQVSSVSGTKMMSSQDMHEDDVLSPDMGQGSLHDLHPDLAANENALQIVPWEIRDEISASCEPKDESNAFTHRGADILATTRMFGCFEIPPIPLCRLYPYARVRGLRDDVSGLKSAFAKEGYLQEKGSFIVSLWTCQREEKLVTDDVVKEWDPIWLDINAEFERELVGDPRLSSLSCHMFYVWEGNHRTVAWTQAIKEKFSSSREKHSRVLCTIIDPTKVPEIALLSSLQRMNFMNSHSLVTTHLRDEIVNLTHICGADHLVYLKALPEKDQKLIADVRKFYSKGEEPWYPLTRKYLARLVYDVQMTKEFNGRVDQLSRESLSEEDLKKEREKIYHDLTTKYSDRIGKLLNIVDPHLGADWLARVLSLKWGCGSWATLEKINLIAVVDAPIQNKLFWLSLLEADNLTRAAYGIKKGDHLYRIWLRREGFLARVYDRASQLVTDMLGTCGDVELSPDNTLSLYFEEVKLEARPYLFPLEVSLEMRTKDVDKQALKKIDTLRMAAQRLAYRFLAFLVTKKILQSIPLLARKWTQLDADDSCMYTEKLHKLSTWEIEACPWWMDMEKGHVLARERDLRDAMLRDIAPDTIGDTSQATLTGVACSVPPPNPPHSSSGPSKKGKETVMDTIADSLMEDVPPSSHDIGGSSSLCRVLSFVYPDDILRKSHIPHDFDRCHAIVGDYISISQDFSLGVRSPPWAMIHEHMLKVRPHDVVYRRSGREVAWAADFIFLDLPYGGNIRGYEGSPAWDRMTEDHVRAGLHLAWNTLSDSGWLLIMASMAGDSLRWVERFSVASDMQIYRRIVVLHHAPYGFMESRGDRVEFDTSMLYMVHRRGPTPPLYTAESMPYFLALGMKPTDSIMPHFIPDTLISISSIDRVPWRGSLQRSTSFLAAFVELLCRSRGICLEFGCGTAPVLETCAASGRVCGSLDSDECIITGFVQPMLRSRKRSREDALAPTDIEDDGDRPMGGNPFDD